VVCKLNIYPTNSTKNFSESRVNHLTQLFQALIDLCLNQSPAEEQNELARQIDKLFNSATAKLPTLYE
jgi:hypothetical protein